MNPGRGGIPRLAPLLLASLLLHLGVGIAVVGITGKEKAEQHAAPRLTVDYIEPPGSRQARPEPASPLPVPVKPPESRHVMQPKALPITRSAQWPLPPGKKEAQMHPEVKSPASGQSSPAQNGRQGGAPFPKIAPLPPAGNGGAEMTVGTYGGSGKGSGSGSGSGDGFGTGRHGNGAGASPGGDSHSATSGASLQRRAAYQALLKSLIEAHREYPLAARRRRQEGSCLRRFTITRSGALKKVESVSSCGYEFFDDAATRAITAVGTFPPVPDEIKGAEATFDITIKFTLPEE